MTLTEWSILLFLAGVILLGLELLLPTHGLIGAGGVAAVLVAIGLAFAINAWVGLFLLAGTMAATPFVFALATKLIPRMPMARHLVLPPVESNHPPVPVQIGQTGVTISELRPMGVVEIGGQRVEAASDYGMIPAGTQVRIVSIDSRRPTVRAV